MILFIVMLLLAITLFILSRGRYNDFIARIEDKDYSPFLKKLLPPGLLITDWLQNTSILSFPNNFLYPKIKDVFGAKTAAFQLKLIYGKAFSLMLVGLMFVSIIAAFSSPVGEILIDKGVLARPEYGDGNGDYQLLASLHGRKEPIEIQVPLPAKEPTEEQLLDEGYNWLTAKRLLDRNSSAADIRDDLFLPTDVEKFGAMVEWVSNNPDFITVEGLVTRPEYGEEAQEVTLKAIISIGARQKEKEFIFTVSPITLEEKLQDGIEVSEEHVALPTKVGEDSVAWGTEKKSNALSAVVFSVGLILVIGLLLFKELEDKHRQRNREIKLDFPEFLSKLSLLLGAGLNIPRAWQRIAQSSRPDRILDKAINQTAIDIANGMPLPDAMEGFSSRLNMPEVSKFCSIIIQNLRRGDEELLIALRGLAQESWEGRKAVANKLAQEASTKLLLPMVLMLFAIMAVVMLPAGLSLLQIF
jgi:Flp pilus assembly protein TadB